MQVKSLAELKAENEAAEREEASANAENTEAEETEDLEEESTEEAEETSESEESEANESGEGEEIEEWAKPESGAVPVAKHVEMKHKLKGRISEKDSEIERLRQEVEALKSGASVFSYPQNEPKMPLMSDEDIGYDEEKFSQKMAAYTQELIEFKFAQREKERTQKAQHDQHAQKVQTEVDKHYERAAELVAKGKVTEENYRAADHIVRKAMEEVLPGMGESVLDNFIARLKDGSEKVIFHLGSNPNALSQLKQSLKDDPMGFSAMAFLAEKNAQFKSAAVINKPERTLKPDRPLTGGKVVTSSARKAYDKALASDDPVAIMRAKRAAKEKGIDTSNW